MLPSEFLSRYGGVVACQIAIDGTLSGLVPSDPDRYLLVFLATSLRNTTAWSPVLDESVTLPSFDVVAAGDPFIIDHAHHGSLVNIGWRVSVAPLAPGERVYYLSGTMKPKPPAKRKG